MKYSIVIPTMWVPDTFQQQLHNIVDCVDEIVIVNNRTAATPSWPILSNAKIRLLNQTHNIYVNPAWNLGVQQSVNDIVCLLNDDLLFDTKIFNFLANKISDQMGVVGLHMYSDSDALHLVPAAERCWGWGCLMFMHRNTYRVIPDQLKILYGDDYLFNVNKHAGKQNYWINGLANNCVTQATCCSNHTILNPDLPRLSQLEAEFYSAIQWV